MPLTQTTVMLISDAQDNMLLFRGNLNAKFKLENMGV